MDGARSRIPLRLVCVSLAGLLTTAVVIAPAGAQDAYPSRPVRLIVTAAPGGVVDITARVIAAQLAEQFGKPFVVDNRPGAGGIIGAGYVARATPDGQTIMLATPGFTIVPAFHKALPYDPLQDFTPITQVTRSTQVLVVAPTLKVNSLKEFIALAQAHPGKFHYGSGGLGSPLHVYAELFSRSAQVKLVHVSYKGGGGEPLTALMAGEIHVLFAAIPTVLAMVKAGKVRALAVTTEGRRLASMPDVPSISEAGMPGMEINAVYGLVGPARLPRAVVATLRAETVRALAVPAVRDRFAAQDAETVGSTPEEYAELLRRELRRWTEVVKASGLAAEAR